MKAKLTYSNKEQINNCLGGGGKEEWRGVSREGVRRARERVTKDHKYSLGSDACYLDCRNGFSMCTYIKGPS